MDFLFDKTINRALYRVNLWDSIYSPQLYGAPFLLENKFMKDNPFVRLKRVRRWRKANPEKVKEACRRANTIRRSTPTGRLKDQIASSIRMSLYRNKNGRHWETLVGYTVEDLKKHLEKQFKDGMNWGNYGKWHIDHILPISAFNFEKPEDEDFQRCWALKNLRPFWAKDNFSKGGKLDRHFQPRLVFK